MSLQPSVDDNAAMSVRTQRNEANALLLRFMATTADMDDPGRLAALRDELRFVFSRHSSAAAAAAAADGNESSESMPAGIHSLSREIFLRIIEFLSWEDVMVGRGVCTQWRDTCRLATPRIVADVEDNAHLPLRLRALLSVLPNTPSLELFCVPSHNFSLNSIQPIGSFQCLRSLALHDLPLAGSHPYLFQFPNLEELNTSYAEKLEWDLRVLSGVPRLKKLICFGNRKLTGNLRSICILRNTLAYLCLDGCKRVVGSLADIHDLRQGITHLKLRRCRQVTGSLNSLCDYPLLEELALSGTEVTTDISDVVPGNFASLTTLDSKMLDAVISFASDLVSNRLVFASVARLHIPATDRLEHDVNLETIALFFPRLRQLHLGPHSVKGSLSSLRELRDVLTKLSLSGCVAVTGSLSDLRDFQKLEYLNLRGTKVVPDVKNIGPADFPSLSSSSLIGDPWRVKDAPEFMRFLHEKRFFLYGQQGLNCSSPDYYNPNLRDLPDEESRHHLECAPFYLKRVKVGPRTGWRWSHNPLGESPYYFETNWLDPVPSPSDEGYEEYCQNLEVKTRERLGPFRGMHNPPSTEEEYHALAAAFIRYPLAFSRNVRPRIE